MHEDEKVSFDPGFSEFSIRFPVEIPQILSEIAELKSLHRKKFEFQRIEARLIPIIKSSAYIYLGCILWGSYLHYRYRENPREITGNIAKETEAPPDYVKEMDFVLNALEELDGASKYYLRRPSGIGSNINGYFRAYREFVDLNNGFTTMETTSDIKIPEGFRYFESYTDEALEELREKIYKIINSGKIESLAGLSR